MLKILFIKICILFLTPTICLSAETTKEKLEMTTEGRLLQEVKSNTKEIEEIFFDLGLTPAGSSVVPKDGRIATNLIFPTKEKGEIMVRLYPKKTPDKLETGWLQFEVEALLYFSGKGLRVPTPLKFNDSNYLKQFEDKICFAYPILPGNPVQKEDLSILTAQLSGNLLAEMIPIAARYVPQESEAIPSGDINHLFSIYEKQSKKYPEIEESKTFQEMYSFCSQPELMQNLLNTPKGIVHADFFFENFLISDQNIASIIDFGDAYYGQVVMDIAIGSMEFSAVSEKKWNFEYLKEFLNPNMKWLRENNIGGKLFIDLMRTNCLRFAIYTVPYTLEEGDDLENNSYAQRFRYLSDPEVQNEILNVFS